MRARSRHELSARLSRNGHPQAEVAAALDRLTELRYLDDERFARDRALMLLREGQHGGAAVLKRLAAHGLTPEQARRALADASAELSFDPVAAARALLGKKGLGGALSAKERARAARLLHSRGFGEDVVLRLLGDPALDPPAPDD